MLAKQRCDRHNCVEGVGYGGNIVKQRQGVKSLDTASCRVSACTHQTPPTLQKGAWLHATYPPLTNRARQYTEGGRGPVVGCVWGG